MVDGVVDCRRCSDAAVLVTAVFLVIGVRSRQQLPATLARSQLVRVQPPTGDYVVEGGVGLFEPAATTQPLAGEGQPLEWEAAASDSATRRLIWVGLDRWQIGRARLPAGLSVGNDAASGTLRTNSGAEATFDAEGAAWPAQASSHRPFRQRARAFPARVRRWPLPCSRMALSRHAQDQILSSGSYPIGELVSDRDRRRAADDPRVRDARAGPCHPCGSPVAGVDRSMGLRSRTGRRPRAPRRSTRRGADYAAATPTRRDDYHSSPWLKFTAVDGPDGTSLTSAYSNERREWVDGLSRQTRISLRFELPAVLLPLKITTARLAATIHAPGREVMVAGWRGGQRVAVATHRSPVRQQLTMQIDDPSILSLDDQGGLILNLDVAPHPAEATGGESRTAWRVSDVYLSCTAVVPPVDATGQRDDL